jgi:AraC family ethanolamine operon transcriptional activator
VLANTFATLVREVIEAANTCADFEASPAAEAVAEIALTVVSEVAKEPKSQEDTQQGRPRIPRREVIRRCKQLFEERRRQPIRVSHLAAAAGVSERTLETAFKEYFGVCPKRYLLVRQLHSMRHALQAADPDAESVTEILIRHGEWEFSRFARRYRDLFGELPSATLKSREPRRSPYGGRAILWSDPAGIER